jgi:ketosteroid isomerase-like protein
MPARRRARSFAAMDTNLSTVQRIYEAFGRGDVPAILAELADDVVWETWLGSAQEAGVPWLVRREGRDEVAGFFAALEATDLHRLEPLNFLAGGDQVAAVFALDLTVKATGARFQDEEIHLWTFGPDGRVTGLRHVSDTAKHIAAAQQPVAA